MTVITAIAAKIHTTIKYTFKQKRIKEIILAVQVTKIMHVLHSIRDTDISKLYVLMKTFTDFEFIIIQKYYSSISLNVASNDSLYSLYGWIVRFCARTCTG